MADGPVRLQKLLSAAGVASRRAAERLILEGRVTVNGRPAVELGTRADPARDDVRVDGRRVRPARPIYLLLNKPRGYVTTRSDPQGRPTVLELLNGVHQYVYPVGRLDYDSEGLLLITNDGEMAQRLMHPRHEVDRVYEVRVRGAPDAATVARLARGVVIEGRRTAPALVRRLAAHEGGTCTLEVVLREGRSRQVRKMCEAVGHPVVRLRRVRFGPLRDDRLKVGAFRPLTAREVARLRRAVGGTETRPGRRSGKSEAGA